MYESADLCCVHTTQFDKIPYTSFYRVLRTKEKRKRRDEEQFSDHRGGSRDRTGVHQAGYNTEQRD